MREISINQSSIYENEMMDEFHSGEKLPRNIFIEK